MIHVVVSSCLLGNPVRYDARDKRCEHPVLLRWIAEGRVITACPEMLGGLGAPRPPAEIVTKNGVRRVITNAGHDVTREFEDGAQATLDEAVRHDVRVAILKSGSPSCGSSFVYDGSFSRTRVPNEGITTALLRQRGIAVFSEDELEAAQAYVASLESSAHAE